MNPYLALGLFAIGALLSWHAHTIYDGYMEEKDAEFHMQSAQKAETNLMTFNQKFNTAANKDTTDAQKHKQPDCLNQPMPADLVRLLH